MYLDMVVPPGGILARISPPDGKASYLGFNDNPVKKNTPYHIYELLSDALLTLHLFVLL